jgi:hypothetical protein
MRVVLQVKGNPPRKKMLSSLDLAEFGAVAGSLPCNPAKSM